MGMERIREGRGAGLGCSGGAGGGVQGHGEAVKRPLASLLASCVQQMLTPPVWPLPAQVALWAAKEAVQGEQPYRTLWLPSLQGDAKPLAARLHLLGGEFATAADLTTPSLIRHLRTTAPSKWHQEDGLSLLLAKGAPLPLVDAIAASGATGQQLAGSRGSLISWPPVGPDLVLHSAVLEPGHLLSWACTWDLMPVASYVVGLSKNLVGCPPPSFIKPLEFMLKQRRWKHQHLVP